MTVSSDSSDEPYEVNGQSLELSPKALCCLTLENKLRRACIWLITWRWFTFGVYIGILINVIITFIFLFVESKPIPDNIFYNIQHVFTVLNMVEAIIRIIARGLCFHKSAYLRIGWNIIDLIVIIIAMTEFIPSYMR